MVRGTKRVLTQYYYFRPLKNKEKEEGHRGEMWPFTDYPRKRRKQISTLRPFHLI